MDLKNFEQRWRCNHPYDDWTPPFRVGPMEEIFSGGPLHEELSNPLPQPVTQPSLNIVAGSSLQKRQYKNEGPHFNPCSIPTDSGLYLRCMLSLFVLFLFQNILSIWFLQIATRKRIMYCGSCGAWTSQMFANTLSDAQWRSMP